MCIETKFVQGLLEFMKRKLDLATEAYHDRTQPAKNVTTHMVQLFYAAKLFEEHMKQVTNEDGTPDIDALNHSID